MATSDDRYAFVADWYDPNAALIRKYQLLFFPKDNTVTMYDIKNRRIFLKRSTAEGLTFKDLYIGAVVNLHSRQLTIVDYADRFTESKLQTTNQKTFALIKPDAINQMGKIIEMIQAQGLRIGEAKMCRLSRNEAMEFYREHYGKPFFETLVEYITSGSVVGMILTGPGAIQLWRDMLGPTDSSVAREEIPGSIRAKFGTDQTRNACHGSDSEMSAERESEFFFPSSGRGRQNTAKLGDCTLCVIKPSAIAVGQTGAIISSIQKGGFEITALQMFHLERANVEEFYEVYKGVVNEYNEMVLELCTGACIALEITGTDAPKTFREFVGPADPEIARHLRPVTLRAKYGKDKIQNAVHCTDLPEDGLLEVEYFFKILDK